MVFRYKKIESRVQEQYQVDTLTLIWVLIHVYLLHSLSKELNGNMCLQTFTVLYVT